MKKLFPITVTTTTLLLLGCSAKDSIDASLSDAQKIANLRKVALSFDSISPNLILPFQLSELGKDVDSASFRNLINSKKEYKKRSKYGMEYIMHMTADNSNGSDAAKFDGMQVRMNLEKENSEEITTTTGGFEVAGEKTEAVETKDTLNLAEHKAAVTYILKQVTGGKDLHTISDVALNYEIGPKKGNIDALENVKADIPTAIPEEQQKKLFGAIAANLDQLED